MFLGIFIILVKKRQTDFVGISFWITSNFLIAFGYLLLGLRSQIPDFLSIIIANCLFLIAGFFRIFSFDLLFKGKINKNRYYVAGATFILFLALFLFFTYKYESILIRTMIDGLLLSAISFYTGLLALQNRPNDEKKIYQFIAYAFFFYALIFISRIMVWLLLPSVRELYNHAIINYFQFASSIVIDISWAMLFFVIYNQKITSMLKESEQRLNLILETSNIGIWDWDLKNDIWYASPIYYTMFGYDVVTGPGNRQFWFEKVHADDREVISKSIQDVLNRKSNEYHYEARIMHADGTYRWVSVIGNVVQFDKDNKPERLMGVRMDITNLKQSEILLYQKNEELLRKNNELILAKEKAENSELQLQTIIDNFPNANISLLDKEMIIKITGGTEYYKYGLNPGDFKNKHISEILSKETYRINKEYIENAFNGISANYLIEYKGAYFMNYAYPIKFNSNEINYVLITTSNISDLKNTEFELIAAKEKAEESDRLKTAFLQNISHEIRTPMNAIIGFSELLLANTNNKAKLEEYVKIINQRCDDLLIIINTILDIAKIDSGQISINIEKCNISNLFSELFIFFKEYQKRLKKEQIDFSYQTKCELLRYDIYTDATKLKQVLINLINNAFKFTDKGKIEFGCKLDSNNNLVFYVSDTGIGIPPDKHSLIFERFYQVPREKDFINHGNGLGLPIVKGLLELLGGEIWLTSEPGKGSTFFLSVPYKELEPPIDVPKEIEEQTEYTFPNYEILVVEDDPFNAEYIREILSGTGLNVIIAENSNATMQLMASHSPVLVLMDIRLPGMDGYELTRILKKNNPELIIIAQTAYAAQEDRQKALDAGCSDYISKPLKGNLLLSIINKHLLMMNNKPYKNKND
jgi:PAS domain S-box-containing protein